jgi:hypothetical protein
MGEDAMTATATSITMYETAEAGFSRRPVSDTTTLTTALYWAQRAPVRTVDWREVITARLAELERLAPGWDSEGALPVGRRHANLVMHFLVRLAAGGVTPLPLPDVVPLADGGVQLEWHIAPGRRIDFVSDEESDPMVLTQHDPDTFIETPARSVYMPELRALLDG